MKVLYKTKDCFLLKNIAGEFIVVARGNKALEFSGTLVLNETCAVMWQKLISYVSVDEIANELSDTFAVDYKIAYHDVEVCIDKMIQYDLLDSQEM